MAEISCCDVIIHSIHFLQWVCLIFEYPRELLPPPSQHPPFLLLLLLLSLLASRTSPFLSPRAHIGFRMCVCVCKSVSESAQPSLDDRGPRTIQTTRNARVQPPPEQLRKETAQNSEIEKQIESKDFCTKQRRSSSRGRVKVSEERERGRERVRGSPRLMRKTSRYHMLCSMANTGCLLLSGSGMLTHSLQCPPAFLYLPEVRQSIPPSCARSSFLFFFFCYLRVTRASIVFTPSSSYPSSLKPLGRGHPSLFPSFHSCCEFLPCQFCFYTIVIPYTTLTFFCTQFIFLFYYSVYFFYFHN